MKGPNGTTANFGNANTWDNEASRIGLPVTSSPSVGTIEQSDVISAGGHVAYVEGASSTPTVEDYNCGQRVPIALHSPGGERRAFAILEAPSISDGVHRVKWTVVLGGVVGRRKPDSDLRETKNHRNDHDTSQLDN